MNYQIVRKFLVLPAGLIARSLPVAFKGMAKMVRTEAKEGIAIGDVGEMEVTEEIVINM
jgi:hypothetical protein